MSELVAFALIGIYFVLGIIVAASMAPSPGSVHFPRWEFDDWVFHALTWPMWVGILLLALTMDWLTSKRKGK